MVIRALAEFWKYHLYVDQKVAIVEVLYYVLENRLL